MSNFRSEALNPATGEVQMAEFLNDYFGPREYGVRFPGSPHVYRSDDILSAENPEDDE
jgi:hypothetical protein